MGVAEGKVNEENISEALRKRKTSQAPTLQTHFQPGNLTLQEKYHLHAAAIPEEQKPARPFCLRLKVRTLGKWRPHHGRAQPAESAAFHRWSLNRMDNYSPF